MCQEQMSLPLNGVDGATGTYLASDLSLAELSLLVQGRPRDGRRERELSQWVDRCSQDCLGPKSGIDPQDLSEAGWGVVFSASAPPEVRTALEPLLELRREQAARLHEHRYRELHGDDGYRTGESTLEFLVRCGTAPGPADPDRLPYYLLLVGGPEEIPFSFQYQLDVQYAVGRISFDSVEGYAAYARAVLSAERGGVRRPKKVTLFGTRNPDDGSTRLSCNYLIKPLADALDEGPPGWTVERKVAEEATRAELLKTLLDPEGPALLFTASHGVGFRPNHPRLLAHQGALLCQDWPGPKEWHGPIPPDHYLSADDLGASARVAGLVAFHFACFAAGTPELDGFPKSGSAPEVLAPRPFVARLPQRCLGHPEGGALAVVGHVDRSWGYSFVWRGAGAQTEVFRSTLDQLLRGSTVGWAMELFNLRYAELATYLATELEAVRMGKKPDSRELSGLWTAHNDARNYVVLGDPAVRLATGN